MKISELRPCDSCDGPLDHIFYVVRVTQAFVDKKALDATLGLNQYFGGGALQLAEVMSPDAEVVKVMGDQDKRFWTEVVLCQDCALIKKISLGAALASREE